MSTHSRQIWEAAESELRSQLSAALARASAAESRAEQAERELAKRDAVRWCSCGRPWIPAAGLYGTTEQTECSACVLQRSLKQAERERDALRVLMDMSDGMRTSAVVAAERVDDEDDEDVG